MLSSVLCRGFLLFLSLLTTSAAFSQNLPGNVPAELSFAGVNVYLTAAGQRRVEQEISRLNADQAGLRSAIEQMRLIDSVLEPLLEDHNAPADLRYACLPFQPGGGYWGLNAGRAAQLQLRVDNAVDESLNLASASEAALTELTALKAHQVSWAHTLLAFLQGQRPAGTAHVPSPDQSTLQLDINSPPAIWTVLARKLAFERETYLIKPGDQFLLYDYRQGQGKSLVTMAVELGIDLDRFVPFNEWLKARLVPADKTYPVLIRLSPSEYVSVRSRINSTLQNRYPGAGPNIRRDVGFPVLRRLPVAPSNDPLTRTAAVFYDINGHRGLQAQPCDNVITLAYYGQMSVKRFMELNDLAESDQIRPGELYYLELKDRTARVPFHVVQPGQTLRDVSAMYGVRLASLLRFNRMQATHRVQSGRLLWMQQQRPKSQPVEYQKQPDLPAAPTLTQQKPGRETVPAAATATTPFSLPDADEHAPRRGTSAPGTAPAGSPASATSSGFVFYTVKQGDTHSGVSHQFNLKLIDLMSWNNLSYRKPLVPGMQLIVSRPATVAVPEETPAEATPQPVSAAPSPAVTQAPAPAPLPTAPVPTPGTSGSGAASPPAVASRPSPLPGKETDVRPTPTEPAPKPATPPRSMIRTQSKGVINTFRVETPKVNGQMYYHVVQTGQTVYRVALINKVSINELMRWNNLSNYTIEVGQRLLIKK